MIVQGKRDVLGSVEEVCEITSNHVVESAHLARIAPKGRCPAMGLEEVMILTDTVVPSGGHDVLDDVSLLSSSEGEPSSPMVSQNKKITQIEQGQTRYRKAEEKGTKAKGSLHGEAASCREKK